MPIDVSTLEESGKEVTETANRPAQDEVLKFLKKNKDTAYMQSEIGEELGMRPQQARQILHRLMEKNIVDRKHVGVPEGLNGQMVDRIFWKLV